MKTPTLTVLICLLFPGMASAENIYGSTYGENIIIGCIDHDGTGKKVWACWWFPYHGEYWTQVGNSSCQLTESVNVYADDGDDNVMTIRSDNFTKSCYYSYVWDDFTHGASNYLIRLYGEEGDDSMYSDLGRTEMYGGNGDDFLSHWIPYDVSGEGNADLLFTWSGSNTDDLYGGSSSDCLYDDNGYWNTFNCGTAVDVDYYVDTYETEPSNCELEVISCFGL